MNNPDSYIKYLLDIAKQFIIIKSLLNKIVAKLLRFKRKKKIILRKGQCIDFGYLITRNKKESSERQRYLKYSNLGPGIVT